MKRIVLLRHAQSVWNEQKRFTGWADVDLTANGVEEAKRAGIIMRENGFYFEQAFVSMLKRTNKTLNIVLDQMNRDWIPVEKSWRLNGRHYGVLEGANRLTMIDMYGFSMVQTWRRSYDIPPQKMNPDDPRSPLLNDRYKDVDPRLLPLGESLKEASERIMPFWMGNVFSSLSNSNDIIVVAHGNVIRAIVKHIKDISAEHIRSINIPTATPYVFEFDEHHNFIKDYYLR